MSLREALQRNLAPWAAMAAGVLGWTMHQQVLADLLYYGCLRANATVHTIVTVLAVAIILAGGAWTFTARRERRVLSDISLGVAGILLLATLAQAIAPLIISPCQR